MQPIVIHNKIKSPKVEKTAIIMPNSVKSLGFPHKLGSLAKLIICRL